MALQAQTQALMAPTPEPEVTAGIVRLERWSQELIIRTPTDRVEAVKTLQGWKSIRSRIVEFFKPTKSQADALHKTICKQESGMLKRGDMAETLAKQKMTAWDREVERIRLEQQRKLQAEADERARKEQERLVARSNKALEKGQVEKAEALADMAQAVVAPVVEVTSVVPKIAGEATRTIWKAKVVHVDLVPREYMVPNMEALNAVARSTKGSIKIPGVEMYVEQSLAIGSR